MLASPLQAFFGNEAERAGFIQGICPLAHAGRFPKAALRGRGEACYFGLLNEFGDDHVPTAHAHDNEDQKRTLGHQVTLRPQRLQTIRVLACVHLRSLSWRNRNHIRLRRCRTRGNGRLSQSTALHAYKKTQGQTHTGCEKLNGFEHTESAPHR